VGEGREAGIVTRRQLLALLVGFTADPERLLWVPGKKLISIPKPAPVPPQIALPPQLPDSFFQNEPLFAYLRGTEINVSLIYPEP
jgi:hypothetical protein